jgi:hypothetical protein
VAALIAVVAALALSFSPRPARAYVGARPASTQRAVAHDGKAFAIYQAEQRKKRRKNVKRPKSAHIGMGVHIRNL